MKMILMGFTALTLLGGGGAGAYMYFSSPAEAAASDEGQVEQVKQEDKVEEKKKFEFVQLDPLILPIVDNNGVSQVISMTVVLEVMDLKAADKVKAMQPKLKDAFIQDMYGALSTHATLSGGVVQVGQIKSRLNRVGKKVMGEGQINDVLLQVVQQRPI